MSLKTIVVALGGNAILQTGQRGTITEQLENIDAACRHLMKIFLSGNYRVVITHGNGPQVGNLLRQNDLGSNLVPPLSLDVCVAATQGMIGYMIQQTLANRLREAGLPHQITTVLTQVVVDRNDLAFQNPTKPIGPYYAGETPELKSKGWKVIKDDNKGYRRVVPSPEPVSIQETRIIKAMLDNGEIVVAVGGGGVPVIRGNNRSLHGIEAVIDKDLAAAKIATSVAANILLILTDVEHVMLNYDGNSGAKIRKMTVDEALGYMREGQFGVGNMLPKVKACINFISSGGERAIITGLQTAQEALEGQAGTLIVA